MKPYSVLLHYPHHKQTEPEYDPETYYGHVEADSPADAVRVARVDAITSNDWQTFDEDGGNFCDPEDFIVALVLEGHHFGLDPSATS